MKSASTSHELFPFPLPFPLPLPLQTSQIDSPTFTHIPSIGSDYFKDLKELRLKNVEKLKKLKKSKVKESRAINLLGKLLNHKMQQLELIQDDDEWKREITKTLDDH